MPSLIERLVNYGADLTSTSDKLFRALAGKRTRDGVARPILVDDYGNVTVNVGAHSLLRDPFGRLRVGAPFGVVDARQVYGANTEQFVEEFANGGTRTYDSNKSSSTLAVTTVNGSSAIRQTREYARYQPGRSQLVFCTGTPGAAKANCQKDWGFFDANDGVFFRQNATTGLIEIVLRTSTSGAPVDTTVTRANWNIDKLDGFGISGKTADPEKFWIAFVNFGWLGGNTLVVGVVQGGEYYPAHRFDFTANTTVFWRTPNLPVRWQIYNTGVTASATSMEQTCCAVISEGGLDPQGYPGGAFDTTAGGKNCGSGNTIPLCSIRLNATYARSVVIPKSLAFLSNSANGGILSLILRPTTLTGATFATAASPAVDFDVAATVVSGGSTILRIPVSGTSREVSNVITGALKLASDVAGTRDICTLALTALTGNMHGVWGGLNWEEYH